VIVAEVTAAMVKALREATGAGMMDCKNALVEAEGDVEKATEILRQRGLAGVEKKKGRSANQGLVDAYVHFNHTVGVLIEINCETDFVANTDEFKRLVKDVALHIASPMAPRYVAGDDVPPDEIERVRGIFRSQAEATGKPAQVVEKMVEGKLGSHLKELVLLDQPFVKDESKTIQQLLDEVSARVGEKVAVRRFVRYKLGEDA
jgi:elongation factor Ts